MNPKELTKHLLPQRKNDSLIMEYFIEAGINRDLLAELNLCHQALQVTCRLDISTGDGKEISDNAWKGKMNRKKDG